MNFRVTRWLNKVLTINFTVSGYEPQRQRTIRPVSLNSEGTQLPNLNMFTMITQPDASNRTQLPNLNMFTIIIQGDASNRTRAMHAGTPFNSNAINEYTRAYNKEPNRLAEKAA
eukprot:3075726-Pyramimonas_sp.AAC.2